MALGYCLLLVVSYLEVLPYNMNLLQEEILMNLASLLSEEIFSVLYPQQDNVTRPAKINHLSAEESPILFAFALS